MERNYIGVDLHKGFFQACAISTLGDRLWEARFDRTADGIGAFRARCTADTHIAVEATGPTWAFVDAVQGCSGEVCVVDPRKTRLKAGFAAKTDRLDARRLADALRRQSVVTVYVPPPGIRELRELCRGRHHVVRVRSKLLQAIRALLLRHGMDDPPVRRLVGRRGLEWLAGQHLPGVTDTVLRRLERLLLAVHEDAELAEAELKAIARADPIAMALTSIVGVGPILALTIRAEIGDIARFPTGAQLASYAGLVPRIAASAGHLWRGPITREGSPWLRWAMVEAAVHAIKRPDRIGRWARRLAVRKGGCTARVALARVLCGDIVRIWPRVA
jgi:transposase